MDQPLISVLMPTYGQATFIPRAIRTLQAQTESRWELHVIDDASPDDTTAAVTPFLGDARIHYRRRPSNGGVGVALNEGLDASTAPFTFDAHVDGLLDLFRRAIADAGSGRARRPRAARAQPSIERHVAGRCVRRIERVREHHPVIPAAGGLITEIRPGQLTRLDRLRRPRIV